MSVLERPEFADLLSRRRTVAPGEIFGELELLGPHTKRTATILSKEGCELLMIDRGVVDKRMAEADPLLRFMMGTCAASSKAGPTSRAAPEGLSSPNFLFASTPAPLTLGAVLRGKCP